MSLEQRPLTPRRHPKFMLSGGRSLMSIADTDSLHAAVLRAWHPRNSPREHCRSGSPFFLLVDGVTLKHVRGFRHVGLQYSIRRSKMADKACGARLAAIALRRDSFARSMVIPSGLSDYAPIPGSPFPPEELEKTLLSLYNCGVVNYVWHRMNINHKN
jgi:hypothetical protein